MKKNKKIVLSFDLDNTLIDNREGIINSFNYTLNKFNLSEMETSKIERMIGTPLNDMFAQVSDIDPSLLSSSFREYYGIKGIFQSKLLPGVKNKLKELKKKNFTLGIVTSKKQEMAKRITKILKINKYFNYIIGETQNIRNKLDPNLKKILFNKYSNHNFIIIGDHPKDVMLSNSINCPFIGVLTGNYSAKQLTEIKDGKSLILNSVREITSDLIYSLIKI